MPIKRVTTDVQFTVNLTLSAFKVSDKTGADLEDIGLEQIMVEDTAFTKWPDAIAFMRRQAEKVGDWNYE